MLYIIVKCYGIMAIIS